MALKYRVRVNPIRCGGRGLCSELFPERITEDDWGYPIVDERTFGPELLETARLAENSCPLMAVLVEPSPE